MRSVKSVLIRVVAAVLYASGALPAGAQSRLPAGVPPLSFGVETRPIAEDGGMAFMAGTDTRWVRRNAVIWSDIEPTQGARNWGAPSQVALEQELINAASKGWKVILIVRSTPAWARQDPNVACGAIKADKLGAFGVFMRDLVLRLKQAPYNVRHWEIWNEPDAPPGAGFDDEEFGCWGDPSDAYFGGGRYANMLAAAHPKIKAADPNAVVLVGGLVLDCDPRPDADTCPQGRFLEGILRAGGGAFFDGISFHAYDFYQGFATYVNAKWNTSSATTGSVITAKAAYLRQVLGQYGASDKLLMLTESAVVCYLCGNTGNNDYELTKMYYVLEAASAAGEAGLDAALWYNFRDNSPAAGSFGTGLRDYYLNPRPAFGAYALTTGKLNGAQFVQRVNTWPGVRVYEFVRDNRRYWAMWAHDGGSHTVTLPSRPLAITMVYGEAWPVSDTVEVSAVPMIVEWQRATTNTYLPLIRR